MEEEEDIELTPEENDRFWAWLNESGYARALSMELSRDREPNLDGLLSGMGYLCCQVETVKRETPKVGRNEPCPCGSGKKFKKCCGKEAT